MPALEGEPLRGPKLHLEIALAAFAGLLLEVAYTRVFSFKVYYYFTYVILGLGLLGIALGGLLVSISHRMRETPLEVLLARAAVAGGAAIPLGYLLIAPLELNVVGPQQLYELAKLLGACLALLVPFLAIGVIISAILSHHANHANRLYAADLLGAGSACLVAIPLLSLLDPPAVIMLSACALTVGGLRPARGMPGVRLAAIGLLALLALPIIMRDALPETVPARDKHFGEACEGGQIEYSRWNPVFRIDVCEPRKDLGMEDARVIFHDGLVGSGLRRFDGDVSRWSRYETDPRALPFRILPPHPKVLIIGAAGGYEVLAALYFGASHVTGVELNPVTHSLVTDVYADFTGHLDQHPRVTYLHGDGRQFLRSTEEKYDLIWFVTPDSYAAMNTSSHGAFVLSESYLYTVEAIRDSFGHLTDQGVVCTAFGEWNYQERPVNTARYVATAQEALQNQGRVPFHRRLLVASSPGLFPPFTESVTLLGASPFTPSQVASFREAVEGIEGGVVRHAPAQPASQDAVGMVIQRSGPALSAYFDDYAYRIDPVRDDAPFFWHFTRFPDALHALMPGVDYPDERNTMIGEQAALLFLACVTLLAAFLLLLPVRLATAAWGEIPRRGAAFTFFSALGLGFMFVEVGLIQKLTLLLGYPTYSLTVTLFSVLVFSGIGSFLSGLAPMPPQRVLLFAFLSLCVLVCTYAFGMPWIHAHAGHAALSVRLLLSAALVAPAGLCLGCFMPAGLRATFASSGHGPRYTAWAWAVNGFFSVIGSVLATILAMAFGYRVLLLLALAIYGIGVFAGTRLIAAANRQAR